MKQAANYELTIESEDRNTLYSLLKIYIQHSNNENINLINKNKIRYNIRKLFDDRWKNNVPTFTKADTFTQF